MKRIKNDITIKTKRKSSVCMKFDFSKPCPAPTTVEECHNVIHGLWQECQLQQKSIEGLTERLNKDSSNSSLPPSNDSLRNRAKRFVDKNEWKKRTIAYWQKRRQGAQRGHKGHGRKLLDESRVHEIIPCFPEERCSSCQEGTIQQGSLTQRKQVFDIKNGGLFVTEYQLYKGKCSLCRHQQHGVLPIGTPVGILGASALSGIAALTGKYKLSKREARELLIDFYELTVSVGTISNAERLVSNALKTPVDEVGTAIREETIEPKHNDETSHFNKHQLEWLWVSTTGHLTFFSIFHHRNQDAAKALIGVDVKGMVVTDRYGAYNWIPPSQRQYCWAHLKRDFKKVKERANYDEKQIGYSLLYHTQTLFTCLRKIKKEDSPAYYKKRLLQTIWQFSKCLKKGRALKATQTSTLCAKLIKEWKSLWHFVRNPLISPTNNHAERQLRHAVLWRKKSFGTQSNRGRDYVERILTCVMTCRQQQKHLNTFISDCLQAHWLTGVYPSLVKEPIESG